MAISFTALARAALNGDASSLRLALSRCSAWEECIDGAPHGYYYKNSGLRGVLRAVLKLYGEVSDQIYGGARISELRFTSACSALGLDQDDVKARANGYADCVRVLFDKLLEGAPHGALFEAHYPLTERGECSPLALAFGCRIPGVFEAVSARTRTFVDPVDFNELAPAGSGPMPQHVRDVVMSGKVAWVQAPNRSGVEPFSEAMAKFIRAGDAEAVRWLHRNMGVSLSGRLCYHYSDYSRNGEYMAPLALANSPAMIDVLVAEGVDPKKAVIEGCRFGYGYPLHVAARHSERIAVLKHLIALGSPVDALNDEGETPLLVAANLGSAKAMQALIAAGADRSVKDADGRDLYFNALRSSAGKTKLPLLQGLGFRVDAKDATGRYVVDYVGEAPRLKTIIGEVKAVLDRGDDVSQAFMSRLAARCIDKRQVTLAEDVMALPEWRPQGADEAVFMACSRGGLPDAVLAQAVAKGFDLEARDADGNTALMVAIAARNLAAVQVLMDAGADPEAKNAKGKPAHALSRTESIQRVLKAKSTKKLLAEAIDFSEVAADEPAPTPAVRRPRGGFAL